MFRIVLFVSTLLFSSFALAESAVNDSTSTGSVTIHAGDIGVFSGGQTDRIVISDPKKMFHGARASNGMSISWPYLYIPGVKRPIRLHVNANGVSSHKGTGSAFYATVYKLAPNGLYTVYHALGKSTGTDFFPWYR